VVSGLFAQLPKLEEMMRERAVDKNGQAIDFLLTAYCD